MANVFEEIGHGVAVAAKEVAHIVVESVEFPAKAEKVLATAIKDTPALRSALTALVKDGEAVGSDVLKNVGEKGLNFADDTATIQAVIAFFKQFKGVVVPAIEAAYGELEADVA